MVSTGTRVGPTVVVRAMPGFPPGWEAAARVAGGDGEGLPPRLLMRTPLVGEGLALVAEAARRQRVQRALPAAARHRLPEVLRIGDDAGRPWILFDAVVAVPLLAVASAPVPVPLALALAGEVVAAMRALEAGRAPRAAGVVDERAPLEVRWEELLITAEGRALLLTAPPGASATTPGLMVRPQRDRALFSPERAAGRSPLSEGADVWTVGALLEQLIAGTDADEVQSPRPPVSDVPAAVRDLVLRAMAPTASDRHESLTELHLELERALDLYPPVGEDERAALVDTRAAVRLDEARRSWSP